MAPKALSPRTAIEMYPPLGSVGTLANLRMQKRGPKYHKVGRRIVYRPEDIENYLFAAPVLTRDSVEAQTSR